MKYDFLISFHLTENILSVYPSVTKSNRHTNTHKHTQTQHYLDNFYTGLYLTQHTKVERVFNVPVQGVNAIVYISHCKIMT